MSHAEDDFPTHDQIETGLMSFTGPGRRYFRHRKLARRRRPIETGARQRAAPGQSHQRRSAQPGLTCISD